MTDNRKPAWEKEDGLRTPDFGREFDTRWSPPWWKTSGKWNNMVLEGFVSVNVRGRRTGESNTPPYLCASIHYCSLCGYMAIINACHFFTVCTDTQHHVFSNSRLFTFMMWVVKSLIWKRYCTFSHLVVLLHNKSVLRSNVTPVSDTLRLLRLTQRYNGVSTK